MSVAPLDILLVEDNPDHAMLTCEGFKEAGVPTAINIVEDGVEAMAYLRHEGKYSGAVRPDIVLLDLNLPRKDGKEVLSEIKSDQALRSIPVIVLTTSQSPDDIGAAYRLHANSYLLKPFEFSETVTLSRSVYEYWYERATLCNGKRKRKAI